MWRNYGQVTRPEGQWVRTTGMVSIIGLEQRLDAFRAFAVAADRASKTGLRFGVELEPDPTHAETTNALKVIGVAHSKGFFSGPKEHKWELGHIWHSIADEIYRDLTSQGVPIAAELSSIHADVNDPEVKLYLLAPKGHSQRDRGRQ